MKPKVYLETTVVSYLTAWRGRDVVMAGNQEETRAWWDDRRQDYDVFISGAVVQEAIAVATVHGMDYLLTWNCRHIANAVLRRQIESVCRANGYTAPIICTPSELAE